MKLGRNQWYLQKQIRMENIQKQSDLLDDVKHKIKDGEYMMMMENLNEIQKKCCPLFVSFMSVTAEARVRCKVCDGSIKNTVICEDISTKNNEEFEFDGDRDDADEIATNVNVTNHLQVVPLVRRVVDQDDERHQETSMKSCAYLPRALYEAMKRDGFAHNGGEVLIYIEDIE